MPTKSGTHAGTSQKRTGRGVPPFTGCCVLIAAMRHIHGWHWNILQISGGSKEYSTLELRFLPNMKMWAGLDSLVTTPGLFDGFADDRAIVCE